MPGEPAGPRLYRPDWHGRWAALSFEVAPLIAHIHANVLKAARAAEADGLPAGEISWARYRRQPDGGRGAGRRVLPCCLMTRAGLVATFDHLHNVPRCRNIRAVLDEYLRLFDEHEDAEPAPDDEILPPDPEPADTLEPAGPAPGGIAALLNSSWLINSAVERLASTDMPHRLRDDLQRWNAERCRRLYEGLLLHGGSWAEANQIFTSVPTGTIGRVECR